MHLRAGSAERYGYGYLSDAARQFVTNTNFRWTVEALHPIFEPMREWELEQMCWCVVDVMKHWACFPAGDINKSIPNGDRTNNK